MFQPHGYGPMRSMKDALVDCFANGLHGNDVLVMPEPVEGQYMSPVRIVAFNTAEGWSRDVSDKIAAELAQACADRGETPPSIADFIADHTRPSRGR
jgi:hypothetical protein